MTNVGLSPIAVAREVVRSSSASNPQATSPASAVTTITWANPIVWSSSPTLALGNSPVAILPTIRMIMLATSAATIAVARIRHVDCVAASF